MKAKDFVLHDLQQGSGLESLHFSACGSYIVGNTRESGSSFRTSRYERESHPPTVVSVPRHFLDDSESQIIMTNEMSHGAIRHDALPLALEALDGHWEVVNNSPTISQTRSVDRHGKATSTSISISQGDVQLSRGSVGGSQVVKLVALPPTWAQNSRESTQMAILPRREDDAVKISIDREGRCSYPVFRTAESPAEIPPSVIERDPRFFTGPLSLRAIVEGTQMPADPRRKRGLDAMIRGADGEVDQDSRIAGPNKRR